MAIGVYEDGKLRFAGKVGSGFTGGIRQDLLKRLKPLVQDDPPFDPPPPKDYRGRWGGDLKDITWVRPELVIRAEIGGWTRDGQVRQTAYKGIEAGRDPNDVVKETAVATTTAVREAEAAEPERRRRTRSRRCRRSRAKPDRRPAKSDHRTAPEFAARRPTRSSAALDALGKEGVWQIGGRELKLTNLDKPLFEGAAARRHQSRPSRSAS